MARPGPAEGDAAHISETPEGLSISPSDPAFERQTKAAESILKRYRNAFHELASK